jgi:hypothetical protein
MLFSQLCDVHFCSCREILFLPNRTEENSAKCENNPGHPKCSGRCWKNIEQLQMQMGQLEKDLREASKAREQRLRRAPIEYRASLAFEMQDMDQEVLALGRELAMCMLEVQLDYLYVTLEDELLQVFHQPLLLHSFADSFTRAFDSFTRAFDSFTRAFQGFKPAKSPIEYRASLAFEMQDMDQEVLALDRELAMCSLKVHLDYLYVTPDELLQVCGQSVLEASPTSDTLDSLRFGN